MLPESSRPKNESERTIVIAGRLVLGGIGAQVLERMATITGSVALLTTRRKDGCLAHLTRDLLHTAEDLRVENRRYFH